MSETNLLYSLIYPVYLALQDLYFFCVFNWVMRARMTRFICSAWSNDDPRARSEFDTPYGRLKFKFQFHCFDCLQLSAPHNYYISLIVLYKLKRACLNPHHIQLGHGQSLVVHIWPQWENFLVPQIEEWSEMLSFDFSEQAPSNILLVYAISRTEYPFFIGSFAITRYTQQECSTPMC